MFQRLGLAAGGDVDLSVFVNAERHFRVDEVDPLRPEIAEQYSAIEADIGARRGRDHLATGATDGDAVHAQDRLTRGVLFQPRFADFDLMTLAEFLLQRALDQGTADVDRQ